MFSPISQAERFSIFALDQVGPKPFRNKSALERPIKRFVFVNKITSDPNTKLVTLPNFLAICNYFIADLFNGKSARVNIGRSTEQQIISSVFGVDGYSHGYYVTTLCPSWTSAHKSIIEVLKCIFNILLGF